MHSRFRVVAVATSILMFARGVDAQTGTSAPSSPAPIHLTCEFLDSPKGIETPRPQLSWRLDDDRRGARQTGYQVLVASNSEILAAGRGDLWDSGWIESDQSHLVTYLGQALASREQCWWKVRIADQNGARSPWSAPAIWEMGLLNRQDWQGKWILAKDVKPDASEAAERWARLVTLESAPKNAPKDLPEKVLAMYHSLRPTPILRREFDLPSAVRKARAYTASLGWFELEINGRRVSDRLLAPGETHYPARVLYVVDDVGPLLRPGKNVITLRLADGRYHEVPNSNQIYDAYGTDLGALLQLEVESEDGARRTIASDGSWKFGTGGYLKASYFMGECYDPAREPTGMGTAGFDDSKWQPVTVLDEWPTARLEPMLIPPERVIERVRPVAILQPRPGIYVFDLGRNLTGKAEVRMRAPRGALISLRYTEDVWQEKYAGHRYGDWISVCKLWYPETLRGPRAEGMIAPDQRGVVLSGQWGTPGDLYVSDGHATPWHGRFSYTSFRYVEVMGLKEPPTLDDLTGVVIYTDLRREGQFTSSNKLLEDIFTASARSNLMLIHAVPNDNAGAERGAHGIALSLNHDFLASIGEVVPLTRKYMRDLMLFEGQKGLPSIPTTRRHLTPAEINRVFGIIDTWHFIQLPESLYLYTGDRRTMETFLPKMRLWARYYLDLVHQPKNGGLLPQSADWYGDHRDMSTTFDVPGAFTPPPPPQGEPAPVDNITYWSPVRTAHVTPPQFNSNGWLVYWLKRLAEIETHLGNRTEADHWRAEADQLRTVMQAHYYDAGTATYCRGEARSMQGSNALALHAGLPPPEDNARVLAAIIADIRHWNNHQSTGSRLSYPLWSVLTRFGAVDEAYRLMTRTEYPSLGHMLSFGFGTFAASWAYEVNTPSETCVCQMEGFSQIATWHVRELCGVNPVLAHPGFKEILLEPWLPSQLDAAGITVPTPYGELVSRWRQSAGETSWEIRVPPNTSATVRVPCANPAAVLERGAQAGTTAAVRAIGIQDGRATYRVAAGSYAFSWPTGKR